MISSPRASGAYFKNGESISSIGTRTLTHSVLMETIKRLRTPPLQSRRTQRMIPTKGRQS
jgi:hypothetical protein